MYDPPELHAAVDAWWRGLARAFVPKASAKLRHGRPQPDLRCTVERADLLFTQTCGFPLTGAWSDRLHYVATPRYAAEGCAGPNYCSFIVVASDSRARGLEYLRGTRCSINSRISHSGFNALRALIAPLARDGRFFGSVSVSGGYWRASCSLRAGRPTWPRSTA